MAHTFLPLAYALLLSATALAAPAVSVSSDASTATAAAAAPAETVPLASDNANGILWLPDTNIIPQAMRGPLGANILGPQNIPIDRQNADLLAPPTTDAGNVYVPRPSRDTPVLPLICPRSQNAKWPFSLSHNRLQTGGWARQQNRMLIVPPSARSALTVRRRGRHAYRYM